VDREEHLVSEKPGQQVRAMPARCDLAVPGADLSSPGSDESSLFPSGRKLCIHRTCLALLSRSCCARVCMQPWSAGRERPCAEASTAHACRCGYIAHVLKHGLPGPWDAQVSPLAHCWNVLALRRNADRSLPSRMGERGRVFPGSCPGERHLVA